MVWRKMNEMDYGLKENKWDGLWFEGIMRWTMVWRKMNETMTKAEVMLIDDVMMELEINNRTERWSKS